MKFILSTHHEQVMIKKDGIASKGEMADCKVSYFLESDESQITIVTARHLLETDKPNRANYFCDGIGYVKTNESFFGYLNHAISGYLQLICADEELKCDLDVLDRIKLIFDELSNNSDVLTLIKTFRA